MKENLILVDGILIDLYFVHIIHDINSDLDQNLSFLIEFINRKFIKIEGGDWRTFIKDGDKLYPYPDREAYELKVIDGREKALVKLEEVRTTIINRKGSCIMSDIFSISTK